MQRTPLVLVCLLASSQAQAAFINFENNEITIGAEEQDYGHLVIPDAMERAGIPITIDHEGDQDVAVRRMNNVTVRGSETTIRLIDPADFLNSSAGHIMKRAYHAIAVVGETAVQLEEVKKKIELVDDDDDDATLSIFCDKRDAQSYCLVFGWL